MKTENAYLRETWIDFVLYTTQCMKARQFCQRLPLKNCSPINETKLYPENDLCVLSFSVTLIFDLLIFKTILHQ